MNTNLKIALLLGFKFKRYGYVCPYSGQSNVLRNWNNEDYDIFNYKKDVLFVMNALEAHYNIVFEFTRLSNRYKMFTIHGRSVINIHEADGFTLWEMMQKAIELTFTSEVDNQMNEVLTAYPHHAQIIKNLK